LRRGRGAGCSPPAPAQFVLKGRGLRGRGASHDSPNRYLPLHVELDPSEFAELEENPPPTEFFEDDSRSVVARNASPDLPFDSSVNPYRGCEHGCIYCYARPYHEFLGFSSGLDFERKILVKKRAPELLREALGRRSWRPRLISMSGVTDPYQPVERKLKLTRGCLEVLRDFRNPVGIVTKNHLVTRDADVLGDLATHGCASVSISVTTLRNDLQRIMEPRTSVPARRLDALRLLTDAGIPAGVMVAPVIPGLTDTELPAIVEAAAGSGAQFASFMPLRLPRGVEEHFVAWLENHFPDRAGKVMSRLRDTRGGNVTDSRFFQRFRGTGEYWAQVEGLFRATVQKSGLNRKWPRLSTAAFRVPRGPQGDLFEPG